MRTGTLGTLYFTLQYLFRVLVRGCWLVGGGKLCVRKILQQTSASKWLSAGWCTLSCNNQLVAITTLPRACVRVCVLWYFKHHVNCQFTVFLGNCRLHVIGELKKKLIFPTWSSFFLSLFLYLYSIDGSKPYSLAVVSTTILQTTPADVTPR